MSAPKPGSCVLVLTRGVPSCQAHVDLLVTFKLGYKVPD